MENAANLFKRISYHLLLSAACVQIQMQRKHFETVEFQRPQVEIYKKDSI